MMLHDTSAAAKSRPEHRSILSSRVEYCSHYNQYRNLKFNASTQLYLFGALYSLSKYKNIYFREKNLSEVQILVALAVVLFFEVLFSENVCDGEPGESINKVVA